MNIPPITGDGIVEKTAPTFPKTPMTIIRTPLATITMRLPTYRQDTSVKLWRCLTIMTVKWPHLGNTECPDILAVRSSSVPCAPGPSQQTAQPLDPDTPVDGVSGWRWSPREPGTSMVVPDRLDHGGNHTGQDAYYPCQADSWHPPLP